ncbi:quinone-dependent dihydroorotate dehydrogenase [Rathayibacter iranicus]|uniref:Dihydroorotate dehydrogenase (quinone) n=2 Tax=Rathayibacter iranicus TaxID=59737 RepID=A0AAD1ELN7_9MICO|nr:quinone-dependent dihydroorotate dehydrogenase [Rathayibacter iranicus]AZZ54870.1 quinone-dependent dihydroorotate dehydrogenase [Rathayibacter iranicus]MWV31445.1 quinone-dependent dihydroorotate dehydrogenase [Rathayibacter iranicus NCPPB 2253 = VKM Ac-1602]PPI50280.1 dihydroorotate dehydrogenase (quinone) [Rathayibacter iranicus]PPI62493.1 dihydroorotate dehydrogenase (quinone) [Rathayibacter iranicus]PPI73552.1 dihydroorotate dehydrogenase (quinone) [Rathayibacter iranicus]
MYPLLFRAFLSRLDPEQAHHLAFSMIRALRFAAPLARRCTAPAADLSVEALGLRFETPFGMAAGFDKDATAVLGLGALGFGHVEVGTLTARPQPGNERPRLFRLIADRALLNRMGFNNHGAEEAARRLMRLRKARRRPIIGVNIGKSRVVAVDDAIEDYLISTRLLAPLADYLVVNVSSPNTPGLRGLQEIDKLEPLLAAVKGAADPTPLLVKIAPDLEDGEVSGVAELAVRLGLRGIIATNTTISREGLSADPAVVEAAGAGGLSGAPLAARSLEVLRLVRAVVPADFCVISVGGIETAADVRERLDAGASLVQGYSGFVYRGPLWAHQISRGLARTAS